MTEEATRCVDTLLRTLENALDQARALKQLRPDEDGTAEVDTLAFAAEPADGAVIHVYWIGCAGLAAAARVMGPGCRIDRIGCSTEGDLQTRLTTLGRDAYGAWEKVADRTIKLPGFERWLMQTIATTRTSVDPAVEVKTRSLQVTLPAGMTRRLFDRELHRGMAPWSLPDANARYTNYSVGTDRLSRAIELYTGLDPRRDGDQLLGIVETILARHRAGKSSPPTSKSTFRGGYRRSGWDERGLRKRAAG